MSASKFQKYIQNGELVAGYCRVWQCVAACCSMMQAVAVYYLVIPGIHPEWQENEE